MLSCNTQLSSTETSAPGFPFSQGNRALASWMVGSTRERWVVDVNTAEVIMECNNSKPSTDTPSLCTATLEMCRGCDLGVLLQIISGKLCKNYFLNGNTWAEVWKEVWSRLQDASFGKACKACKLSYTGSCADVSLLPMRLPLTLPLLIFFSIFHWMLRRFRNKPAAPKLTQPAQKK